MKFCLLGFFFGMGVFLVFISKLLFYAYGMGAKYDFTGISGHAFRSAFLFPLLAWICVKGKSKKWQYVSVVIAIIISLLISSLRYYFSFHTLLELLAGLGLGGVLSMAAIKVFNSIVCEKFHLSVYFYILGIFVVIIALNITHVPTVRWLRELATWITGQPFYRR
ncbi:phosphatase PAP2 family protein [Halotalea alkalilenta]|uniref:phosphatase PAP2 family protein n=1 Tax=Halotalea alkalilenta TaxID=376489 RepID=UPI00123749A1|nr:phosphatase PAP2 family protein [Halotalea alkalilenta]